MPNSRVLSIVLTPFLILLAALALIMTLSGAPAAAGGGGGAPAAWIELGPDGVPIARAIVDGGAACPDLWVDGRPATMSERAAPTADFPVRSCEAAVPAGAAWVEVAGRPLPLPPASPRRIIVLGDTGCRLDATSPPQACNDPAAWPFAELAASAAAWGPDLIIHVGDYLYREAACPATAPGCAGSPWGDNWATWNADFFAPAAPLLPAAPWVVMRGNHEICARNAGGWFRFLEPRQYPATCPNYTDPYVVPVGHLQLLTFDSSYVSDRDVKPDEVAAYRSQLDWLNAQAGDNAWLVSHKPIWAHGRAGESLGVETIFTSTLTFQAATGNRLAPGIQALFAGHIHVWEYLSFDDGRPPQVVIGNSGTELDPPMTTPLPGLPLAGATILAGEVLSEFGFLTLEPGGAGIWWATLRDPAGNPLRECVIADKQMACAP